MAKRRGGRKCRGANTRLVRRKRGKGRKGRKGGKKQSKDVFALCVNHPGTKAQPYLFPALAEGKKFLRANLARTITKAGTSNPTRLINALDQLASTAASVVLSQAETRVPVDKGDLKGSLNKRRASLMFYTVGTNKVYAEGVEKGTKPHKIFAKKKVLKFPRSGARGQSRGRAR